MRQNMPQRALRCAATRAENSVRAPGRPRRMRPIGVAAATPLPRRRQVLKPVYVCL